MYVHLACCFILVLASSPPFITTWRTTAPNQLVTLPLTSPLNVNVDWGDGSAAVNTSGVNVSASPVSHVYNASGIYNVSIVGDIYGFRFNGLGDTQKLFNIMSWGNSFFMDSTSSYVFSGCYYLQVLAPPNTQPVFLPNATLEGMFMNSGSIGPLNWDLANVTSLARMFQSSLNFNWPLNFSNTQGVTDTSSMFNGVSRFNSSLILDTSNVVNMDSMFAATIDFNQPVNFDTGKVQRMTGMFTYAIAFNQPINFNTSSLTDTQSMFAFAVAFNSSVTFTNTLRVTSMSQMFDHATGFNQPITFRTDNVGSMSYMFNFASRFNQPLNFSTGQVTSMDWMFANAIAFNQPINFNMTSVSNVANMFFNATSFNSTLNFSPNSRILLDTTQMFRGAVNFNQPLALQTDSVRNTTSMFSGAVSFNQPINFSATSLQNSDYMFQGATAFNSAANFTSAPVLASAKGMFLGATQFNQPINLNTSNLLVTVDSMFLNATSFNSTVSFTNTRGVTNFSSMFMNAVNFNQPVTFQTDSAADMHSMFSGATRFNQPVNFSNTSNVTSMQGMFFGASSFNQIIDFQANKLLSAASMFANAVSFNKAVVLQNTGLLNSTASMFANATSFNSTVNISSTASVTNMEFMFSNVDVGFGQRLASWSTDAVTKCDNFCEYCGLPSFPRCVPCGNSTVRMTQSRGSVCKCPAVEPNCDADLCKFFQVAGPLQVDCLAPTPTPAGSPAIPPPNPASSSSPSISVVIISPLFNITHGDDHGNGSSSYVFTLPISPQAFIELGKVSYAQSCGTLELSCEWQDPQSLEFLQSGCAVTKSMVDMGSGVVGTECTCTHLTVFAIALRNERQLAPLCHASDVDYALLGLYGVLALCLLIQLARLVYYKLHKRSKASVLQHCLVLLACVLRIAFLIAKPVIKSLAGLVMLGLLPSAISLTLFIYLMLAWTSLQLATFSSSPFARFRVPLILIAIAVLMLVVALVIAVAMTKNPTDGSDSVSQLDVVVIGSYVFAALSALVCALVLLAGLCLRRTFSGATSTHSTSSSTALNWRVNFSFRVLIATIGLSSCLFLSACLWAAAVQTDIIVNDAATLGTTTAFYVSDWLSLCVLTWLLSGAIAGAAKKSLNTRTSVKMDEQQFNPST